MNKVLKLHHLKYLQTPEGSTKHQHCPGLSVFCCYFSHCEMLHKITVIDHMGEYGFKNVNIIYNLHSISLTCYLSLCTAICSTIRDLPTILTKHMTYAKCWESDGPTCKNNAHGCIDFSISTLNHGMSKALPVLLIQL